MGAVVVTAGDCVLVHLDAADTRRLQLADVVVCRPGTARGRVWEVLAELPGCAVVATRSGRRNVVAVRGVGELGFHGVCVVTAALCCYWSLVSGVLSSASSLACTCCARGMSARR